MSPVRVRTTVTANPPLQGVQIPPTVSSVIDPDDLARAIREGVDARLRELAAAARQRTGTHNPDISAVEIDYVAAPREPAQERQKGGCPRCGSPKPHLHYDERARVEEIADLRTRLAAAKAREARLVRVLGLAGTLAPQKWADERRAAITADGSALAQAIEEVLADDDLYKAALRRHQSEEVADDLCGRLDALRREWGQR